jgi:hypothetical protein
MRLFKIETDTRTFYVFAYSENEAEHYLLSGHFAQYTKEQLKELNFDTQAFEIKPGIAIETNN